MTSPASEAVIARLLAAREQWVDLQDGVAVKLRRPAVASLGDLRRAGAAGYLDCAVDWRGVSESVLFPADTAASGQALPFDLVLWRTAAADNGEWVGKVVDALVAAIESHAAAAESSRKN